MRSYFNIKIKGKNLWKVCALFALAVFLVCCSIEISQLDQPTTGIAGQVLPITAHCTVSTNISNSPILANYIIGFLMPKGWNAGANTTATYISTLGNGNMEEMPPSILETESINNGTNLSYSAAMLKKFGIGQNLVADMEWVVFRSTQQISIPNVVTITGEIDLKITAGIDGNTTIFKPAYVICESVDGISHFNSTTPDYGYLNGPRLTVTGPGDVVDLCDPLLTSLDPPKSLDNDFLTLTYNEKLDTANKVKGPNFYLCVDTVITSDNKKLTGFCTQSPKSILTQTTSNSGLYKITFWPRSFFSLPAGETASEMIYHIIDANGNKVGFADTDEAFTYKFKCN